MTRLRYAVLLCLGAAFLAAPLSALCSSCCVSVSGGNAMSAPMPCCDGSCGPSFTAARPRDPAVASSKIRIDPPLSTAILQPGLIELPVFAGWQAAMIPAGPTESPPPSSSVLRL